MTTASFNQRNDYVPNPRCCSDPRYKCPKCEAAANAEREADVLPLPGPVCAQNGDGRRLVTNDDDDVLPLPDWKIGGAADA